MERDFMGRVVSGFSFFSAARTQAHPAILEWEVGSQHLAHIEQIILKDQVDDYAVHAVERLPEINEEVQPLSFVQLPGLTALRREFMPVEGRCRKGRRRHEPEAKKQHVHWPHGRSRFLRADFINAKTTIGTPPMSMSNSKSENRRKPTGSNMATPTAAIAPPSSGTQERGRSL
jgi:hypothetical protein